MGEKADWMNICSENPHEPGIQTGRQVSTDARKVLRVIAVSIMMLAGIIIFTLITSRTDYISYWAAGKLLIHHSNPYSPAGALAIQKAAGFTAGFMVMLNPPWALFLAAPLGFGGIRFGLFLWTLATAGCIIISTQLLDPPRKERAFAYVFAPAIASVVMGQSSAFLLLGFALFLRFHKSRPFLAGASLLLMTIKPHLFLLFWALLLVDCIYRRRFLIIAGGISALAAATAFAMCFDAHVCQDYIVMLRTSTLRQQFFPTISMMFRLLVDARSFWLLFVPSALALIWALWYYASRRQVWDWKIHGMLLMLVCILFSPYSWLTDEVVLLPSILFALASPVKRKYSAWILLVINSIALYTVFASQAALVSLAYFWTPIAWLAWFLYASRGFKLQRADHEPPLSTPDLENDNTPALSLPE